MKRRPVYVRRFFIICSYGLAKFRRFAINVWGVDPAGKTDEAVAEEGLTRMETWMKELGLVMNIRELGATEEMLEGITKAVISLRGGYKALTPSEVFDILKAGLYPILKEEQTHA